MCAPLAMSCDVNSIFKTVESLIKYDVPFSRESEAFRSAAALPVTPKLVSSFQQILNQVDVDSISGLPWFDWLSALCCRLVEGVEHLDELANLAHISVAKASVSKLITCVMLPNLSCELPYPSTAKSKYQLSDKQKLGCVDLVVRVVLLVLDNAHTRAGVLRHFGELLGALLFLNSASLDRGDSDSVRSFYRQTVTSLLDNEHQTTVFTHLMILHSTKGDHGKISRVVRKVLDTKLQRQGGVAALLGATLMADQAPASTQDVMKICNLLTGKHPDAFYHAVLPQVLGLLREKECKGHQVTAGCIALLQERDAALCERLLLGPLLAPLESPCPEGEIENTLHCLKGWVDAAPPGIVLSRPLPLLCLLYASTLETPTALKSILNSVLLTCFSRLPLPCNFVMSIMFPPHPGVVYSLTSSCSVVSIQSDEQLNLDFAPKIILDFINTNKLVSLKVDLYRSLLRFVVDPITPLDQKLISTELLTELSSDQSILDSLCDEPQHLVDFLVDLFSNDKFDSDSVLMGLVLLTIFLNDKLVHKKSNWGIIGKLEDSLLNLNKSSHFEVKTLASEVLCRLSDLGIIKSRKAGVSSEHGKEDEKMKTKRRSATVGDRVVDCEYEEAIKECTDPLLPVRAHALRSLAKLLRAKDKTTLKNKTTLLNLFKANLDDNDSYLYLSAVEGLSSLACVFPDDVILSLCEEFVSRQGQPEFRLKIGQILVKTTNIMGEMAAVYKKELLAALLVGSRDPDPLVRASSLSNIGEIAKILSFRIHDFLVEVLYCVECTVDSDKEAEPRRAAVMLVALLLQGLASNTISVLEDVLPSLYRKLKAVYQHDRDDVTRLHAQIALEHLSQTMRSFIFSKPDLVKSISVLDISKP